MLLFLRLLLAFRDSRSQPAPLALPFRSTRAYPPTCLRLLPLRLSTLVRRAPHPPERRDADVLVLDSFRAVTGANRGIGLALTSTLARRPGTLVFATARQPAKADDLNALAKELGNVEVVQYEGPDAEQTKALADVIEKKAGKVDVVFANAGARTLPLSFLELR